MQTQADIINAAGKPSVAASRPLRWAPLIWQVLQLDYWKSKEDVLKNWAIDKTFTPQIMDAERGKRIKGWEKAVKYAYGWARDEED